MPNRKQWLRERFADAAATIRFGLDLADVIAAEVERGYFRSGTRVLDPDAADEGASVSVEVEHFKVYAVKENGRTVMTTTRRSEAMEEMARREVGSGRVAVGNDAGVRERVLAERKETVHEAD